MRQYETGFVLSPTLSEEETAQFVQQMAEIVAQKKGRMVKQDIWGKRRMAFPIKRFQEGIYVFFTYEGAGDVSAELERRFKQTEAVIRFMTVLRDPRDLTRRKKKRRAEDAARAAAEQTDAARAAVEQTAAAEPAVEQTAAAPAEVKEEK
ncbi:MAG: 30S ribosomal protein S6 [Candidatus Aminicenantes bacterium]|nr:30S ribosomal protein S6 [Candidatus Aminicenantes bacterium]